MTTGDGNLPIDFSLHAERQMKERGVVQHEVITAIRKGEPEPARKGRTMFRKNIQFEATWRGQWYRIKQVAPVVVKENDRWVVITVYAFYF